MKDVTLETLLAHTAARNNGCMEWQRARSMQGGYGVFYDGPKRCYAHRTVASLVHGEPLPGQFAMHICDNPPCINPDHLRWGSPKQNSQDASLKGRLKGRRVPTGEAHGMAKLTPADVVAIRARRALGEVYRTIASDYSIDISTVRRIAARKTWREIP